jgi:formylglycine-generating enzyme required for sulfatase activity
MPLTQGQILKDRYRIVKLLGQGGFGAVYRAWDTTLNVPCAVKESFELSPEGQRQFLREAQILAGLRHANLPRVTDYFALPGQGQYLVMDYVEGEDLEALRAQAGGRLPEAQALPWITQVCEALDYLHSQMPAVIHRDIKPANIKITPDNRAMLVDFGIAKTYDPQQKTTMGARAFTPGFSPIEQYGKGTTDARSDIYSLGATLYALLTGIEPPEATQRAAQDTLIPPGQANPAISTAVRAVLVKALKMNPTARFQNAGEFRAAISSRLPLGSSQSPVGSAKMPLVTQLPAPRPASRGKVAAAAAPVPVAISPATQGVPLPVAKPPFPWKWVGVGVGVLTALVVLAGLAGLAVKGISDNRVRKTAQAFVTAIQDENSPLEPMSLIPGGTFQMGSERGNDDEMPVHSVILESFWMDQTEVTNGMYAQCEAAGACEPPWFSYSATRSSYYQDAAYADFPVIYVDWSRATAYCTWAGRRLPTEAEWEYAARGGWVGLIYPWGDDDPSCTLGARTGAQAAYCPVDDTIAVGSFAPNGYGLYDMAGNVWEWVADWYGSYFGAAYAPVGPASGEYRVLRGGSWGSTDGYDMRVTNRAGLVSESMANNFGFRCARSASGEATPTPRVPSNTMAPSLTPSPSATLISPTNTPIPSQASLSNATPTPSTDGSTLCDRAAFVTDITIPDNTEIPAGTPFVKTWRLRNTGTCTWTSSYAMIFYSGDAMSGPAATQFTTGTVPPGATIDVSVTLIAPTTPGTYRGEWRLRNAAGATFGIGPLADQSFWLQIRSVASGSFAIGSTQVSSLDGMVLSYISAGTFLMGSEDGDDDEQPVHSVTLDAFWMDQTEVTNGMYAQCVTAGACSSPRDTGSDTRNSYYSDAAYADYPVIYVDWNQAVAYCEWAGRQLPTEAQWEYAARGGLAGALYPWGNTFDGELANSCDANCSLDWSNPNFDDGYGDTAPVGSYPANGYGLYDMAGNVWEWVADWYGLYSSAAVENPTGPASGEYRLLRGGSWSSDEYLLRVSYRNWYPPDFTDLSLGFRCSLSP